MTTDVDLPTAVSQQFPSATSRASLDCPAFNIPAGEALALLRHLRDVRGYDFLMDVTAIDWSAAQSPRFTVVWHLYSSTGHTYVRVASDCASDTEPAMPTATGLWAAADWHERETYDMLGIHFTGHPDLRRILMWDGYPYFPLRKEFPLAGLPTELADPEIAAEVRAGVIAAPMAGGPFVAQPGEPMSAAEPRAKDEAWNEAKEKPQ
ncbi:MAG: NADH-quinone oxidoreductase subunit C [Opitutaceae bacterium]|nr:NADH-quinone oxidoreductase subunit C [Opitutaceae bacterium]